MYILSGCMLNGVFAMASHYRNRSPAQSTNSFSCGSRPVHQLPWRREIHQRQEIIIEKLKQLLFLFCTCPSICLKDAHLFAATDHHRKLERISPCVLHLSINLFEGRTLISSNRSSSQSTNSFSFCSRPVPKCPWRTEIHQQQQIIIAKYKQFLFRFSTCPEVSLKDGDPSAATDHHRKVQTVSISTCPLICLKDAHLFATSNHHRKVEKFFPYVRDLSIDLVKGLRSNCGNKSLSKVETLSHPVKNKWLSKWQNGFHGDGNTKTSGTIVSFPIIHLNTSVNNLIIFPIGQKCLCHERCKDITWQMTHFISMEISVLVY